MDAEIVQIVTTALAVLGAVLGLYNAWRNWVQDRVRLRVAVTQGFFTGGGRYLMVECVNLSSFPVTVTHMGFDHLVGGWHAQVASPQFLQGDQRLPLRLEPRTSATAAVALAAVDPEELARWRCAYVSTACGLKIRSSWRKFRRLKAAIAPQHGPSAGEAAE